VFCGDLAPVSAEKITSLQNPRLKQLVKLRDRRPRDEAGLFLIEGYREVRRALEAGVKPVELYCGADWFLGVNEPALIEEAQRSGAQVFDLSKEAFAKVSYRDRPDGLLAVAAQWKRTLADLDGMSPGGATPSSRTPVENATGASRLQTKPEPQGDSHGETPRLDVAGLDEGGTAGAPTPATAQLSSPQTGPADPFLLVIEAIEKPGNLGTILRSADAAGISAVIVCDPVTDIFNPNVVRSSTGVLFSMPIVVAGSPEVRAWLGARRIRAVATTPAAKALYTDSDLRGPLAIIMGSEQYGLSEFWLKESDLLVRIPMAGQADSLNVAMATVITLFEAVRQRGREQDPAK
jgi:TrmH family RNA methyltransferase